MDPKNSGSAASPSTFYAFACSSSLGFEINTNMESTTYKGSEATDGGDFTTVYEVGTDMTLLPSAIASGWYLNN